MGNAKKDKFAESGKMFKDSSFKKNKIVGCRNWEVEHGNFKLESWNHVEFGPVIVQIWEGGNGFSVFVDYVNIKS